jgi:hypothetical protein
MSTAAQASAAFSPAEVRGSWARQGADSLAAALRIISDLTAQEIALLVGMLRERVGLRPDVAALKAASRVVTGFTGTGKILLDLAAGETATVTEGLKEVLGLRPSLAALVDLVPRGVGTLVEMEKRVLDAVADQTRDVVESYAEGKPFMATERVATMARRAIEGFIETQKTFLDEVAEQVTIATEGGKETKAARRERSKALIEMSRESIAKFIEAQKQVADLAFEQIAGDSHPRPKAAPRTSVAELTRKSVRNFTEAQKSLLDLALRPIAKQPEEAPRKPRTAARRGVKPRKRAAAADAD